MRNWPVDHPKARLLKRKRDAILDAARRRFLASGYDATSMEAIAAEASVSIMTLYRHARSKDELFEAIVTLACDPEHAEAGMSELLETPLREALIAVAQATLDSLTSTDNIAMLRAVIAETARFPHLGALAYRGVVGRSDDMLREILGAHPETAELGPQAIERGARAFVERLFGDEVLRLLLGVSSTLDPAPARAAAAADALIAAVTDERRGKAAGPPRRRARSA
jgi:TetR/AcrR family transcriptional repressor of mexJK operon